MSLAIMGATHVGRFLGLVPTTSGKAAEMEAGSGRGKVREEEMQKNK